MGQQKLLYEIDLISGSLLILPGGCGEDTTKGLVEMALIRKACFCRDGSHGDSVEQKPFGPFNAGVQHECMRCQSDNFLETTQQVVGVASKGVRKLLKGYFQIRLLFQIPFDFRDNAVLFRVGRFYSQITGSDKEITCKLSQLFCFFQREGVAGQQTSQLEK